MKRLLLFALVASICGTAVPSHAAVQIVIAPPGAQIEKSFDGVDVAVKSQLLTFYNLDYAATGQHNIASVEYGASSKPWCVEYALNQCPLFASKLVGAGGNATVDLAATVAGKTYPFVCHLHGDMKGTLQIVA